jgi:hypothetical protein
MWFAMLKLRIAGSAPWFTANTNTIRAQIPAIKRPPASQPTRASATPSLPVRTCVAKHAQREPNRCKQRDERQVVACGRNRVHVALRNEEHDDQRNHQATNIQLPLTRLTKNNEDENCVYEVIGSSHGVMVA